MSIPNPPSPSASQPGQPTRRDRMANALRTLMTNDAIDPEILRAGTEWMTALDVERTQTLTPQAMFPAPDLPADGPYLDAMPIDPALRNQSPFPLDTVSGTSSASSESWLGDVYNASSSPSNNVQADPMSCDPFTLDFAWISNEWDVLLNSAEMDQSSSSTDPIVQTPLPKTPLPSPAALPMALPSVNGTSMRPPPPSQISLAANPRSPGPGTNFFRPRPSKHQRAHYIIEKRYRAGLSERFEALRDCVESWKQQQQQKEQQQSGDPSSPGTTTDGTNEGAPRGPTRLNKSEVLCEAVAYIKLLQDENEVVMEHMKLLIRRFRATRQALHQM